MLNNKSLLSRTLVIQLCASYIKMHCMAFVYFQFNLALLRH